MRRLLILLFFLQLVTPVHDLWAQEPRRVVFLPQWSPQAQFAGYYVAQDKGFYAKRGIDLEMARGGPDRPPVRALASGEADFATLFLSTGIEQRSKGMRLVNIGQIVQRSALALVSKKSAGILSPEDLNGKRVAIWPEFALQPQAFFRKYGLNVTAVPLAGTVNLFLRDGVQATSAMVYNEYHTILNSGLNPDELMVFTFSEHGLNFPEDGIYCMEDLVRRDPGLCRDFVLASIEGWLYAFDHPEEALAMVMERVDAAMLPTNKAHQRWMLGKMRDFILPSGREDAPGRLLPDEYLFVAGQLLESGIIKDIPDFGEFHVDLLGSR